MDIGPAAFGSQALWVLQRSLPIISCIETVKASHVLGVVVVSHENYDSIAIFALSGPSMQCQTTSTSGVLTIK